MPPNQCGSVFVAAPAKQACPRDVWQGPTYAVQRVFLLIAGAATLGLTGCGSGDHDPNSSQTYTITVTASAAGTTGLQHTATVTLIVQ
jgi:hypothetical protein